MVELGSGAAREASDWVLSRGACYLIAMNADPGKKEVGFAQAYFAIQTRRQERMDALTDAQRRLELRRRVKSGNLALNSAAKASGVKKFPVFHAAGYQGQYNGLNVKEIKAKKGIPHNEEFLDCIGRAELAMNEFRITQTERILRERVRDERTAIETHHSVGCEVRDTVRRIDGTMPEDLPREPSIKGLDLPPAPEPPLFGATDEAE